MGFKTMVGGVYLLFGLASAVQAQGVSGDAAADASQLSTYARKISFATRIDGTEASLDAFDQARQQAPEAAKFAKAYAARYPGKNTRQVEQVSQGPETLRKAGQQAAARYAETAHMKAEQARSLKGAARDVLWKQASDVCKAVLWLDPTEKRCVKITGRADAHAEKSRKAKAAALAKAKMPKEVLKGRRYAKLRKKIAKAYEAAWKSAPVKVLLDGKAKKRYVRRLDVHHEDLPVWIMARDGAHCRAFHMTFRRSKSGKGGWSAWKSFSSGHTYPLLCPGQKAPK